MKVFPAEVERADEKAQVGLAVELPGGRQTAGNLDATSFLQFLLNKETAYERIPADRFNLE